MFKVQIDMSEFNEKPLWQDIRGFEFDTQEQAQAQVDWLKSEYGTEIPYRIV